MARRGGRFGFGGWGGHYHHPHGPGPWWGGRPWLFRRPSTEEEKQALDEYITELKEELQAAEEYRRDLDKGEQ